MTSSSRKPWRSNGGGLVGKGCVGEYHSRGTVPFSTGRSSIGHTGSPVCAIEHEDPALLGRLRDRLDRLAVDGDVGEDRRARDVVVPDRMVDELEVPEALAGLQIDGDEALAEQIVAGPMAAEVVAGRNLDRQVRDAELFVDGHLRPDAGVAGVGPRVLQPRVVAELAGLRNGVEDPEPLAGPRRRSRGRSPWRSSWLRGAVPARCAAPTMTTFLATTGAPFQAISPVIGSSS